MNKQRIFRTTVMLLALGAAVLDAKAITYQDVDNLNHTFMFGGNTTYNGVFNISVVDSDASITIAAPYTDAGNTYNSALGYIPPTPLASATFTFWVQDDADNPGESLTITVGAQSATGLIILNEGFSIFGGTATGTLLGDIQADGQVTYSLVRESGDFFVDYARLTVNTATASVPEGGATVALLGLALTAVEGLRRKLAVKKG